MHRGDHRSYRYSTAVLRQRRQCERTYSCTCSTELISLDETARGTQHSGQRTSNEDAKKISTKHAKEQQKPHTNSQKDKRKHKMHTGKLKRTRKQTHSQANTQQRNQNTRQKYTPRDDKQGCFFELTSTGNYSNVRQKMEFLQTIILWRFSKLIIEFRAIWYKTLQTPARRKTY